eukprot:Phypoly_transcript_15341.p1 GENE.Phypoly_transcript_15341~~Phypoly_transcript_15341.p1  ORF type:complete len:195 (+),score=23.72 Phypoly_transcript_15341:260-844(+)
MLGKVEIMVKSSKIYQKGKHTTVGTCVIPIASYLTLSSTERIAQFSEEVMANGAIVGVMSGTVIFVDIPSTVTGSRSQSSMVLAPSASDSDITTSTKRDSGRRNLTIDASVTAKLQKQRDSESQSTSSLMPSCVPPPDSHSNLISNWKSLPSTPLSEPCDESYQPNFLSFQPSLASPINSFQPADPFSFGTHKI